MIQEFRNITVDEYKTYHKYDFGSTLILNKIRNVHCKNNIDVIKDEIEKV